MDKNTETCFTKIETWYANLPGEPIMATKTKQLVHQDSNIYQRTFCQNK